MVYRSNGNLGTFVSRNGLCVEFFQGKVTETFGWSNSETAWTFSIAIFMLGITASWGGINLPKYGSRKLALIGSVLYSLGYIISYFALKQSLPLLYFGYGIVGGIGLGLAYVTSGCSSF
jgi:OFA family oxalate/formate antiporter-like MFS transporter